MEVKMPQLGESVAEGTIIKWLVKEGDRVEKDAPLFEISTDKVDAEIPSPESGVIAKILVSEGTTVEVGRAVAELSPGKESGEPEAEKKTGKPEKKPSEKVTPVSQPRAKKRAAPAAARPRPAPSTAAAPSSEAGAPIKMPQMGSSAASVRSSPIARRIAREHGVDIARIQGTGRDGRVSKKDVLAFVDGEEPGAAAAAAPASGAPAPPAAPEAQAPAFPAGEDSFAEPMSIMRKKIAGHMVMSKRTSPHVLTVFEVDITRVQRLRAARKSGFESRHGARLTLTAMAVHSVVPAILRFPVINASVSGDSIVYHRPVNIGVAVALEDGLIVPVIKQAERLGIGEIARALQDLSIRAREKKLVPDDVQGATFTITNPGPYGALFNFPVINQPNVAILGMGGARKRPVVVEDAIAIREIVCFSLSFDHRAIDGAVADQFMAFFKERLESFPEEVLD
ncbi:MAG: dihydrolipoamide acetyltransferase family protein [Candidatus Eisenbacteria bacterium]